MHQHPQSGHEQSDQRHELDVAPHLGPGGAERRCDRHACEHVAIESGHINFLVHARVTPSSSRRVCFSPKGARSQDPAGNTPGLCGAFSERATTMERSPSSSTRMRSEIELVGVLTIWLDVAKAATTTAPPLSGIGTATAITGRPVRSSSTVGLTTGALVARARDAQSPTGMAMPASEWWLKPHISSSWADNATMFTAAVNASDWKKHPHTSWDPGSAGSAAPRSR